jgi:hypothetical protein
VGHRSGEFSGVIFPNFMFTLAMVRMISLVQVR